MPSRNAPDLGDVRAREAVWARTVAFWHCYDEMEARLTRPLSERMLDMARVSPGMHVLDVACGRGEPALPAAHRVGPRGRVLGVDMVEGMLEIARERARREGLANVELEVADAEALDVGEECFDVATLRWGLMYMASPERALQAIRRALKPGGVLVIASWAEPARAPFVSLPRRILERYRDVALPTGDGPGTFRHADFSVLAAILERNGFSPGASEELEVPVVEASDGMGIVEWVRQMGGVLVTLVDELPEPLRRAWADGVALEAEKHRVGDKVSLGGVTRITLARRSER